MPCLVRKGNQMVARGCSVLSPDSERYPDAGERPWNLAAIEVTLRKLEFRQYEAFRPTAHHMTLGHEEFYKAIRVPVARPGPN